MQNLRNLSKWVGVKAETAISFPSEKTRKVKLLVKAPERTVLNYMQGKTQKFLTVFSGMTEIQFGFEGKLTLIGDGYFDIYTAEQEIVHAVNESPISFTRITERPPRNPELELMQFRMQQNQIRMLETLRNEFRTLGGRPDTHAAGQPAANVASNAGVPTSGHTEGDGHSEGAAAGGTPTGDPAALGEAS